MPKASGTRIKNATTRAQFPASRKVYIEGSRNDIRVPMREISLSPTQSRDGEIPNPPLLVYDTSGPYGDAQAAIDLERGLPPIRDAWIAERDDSETQSALGSDFGRARRDDPALAHLRFAHLRAPRKARRGCNVTQMHYARKGIVTP